MMAMMAGARWKRWIFLYIPMTGIMIITLFPFYYMAVSSVRPDREMYIPWNKPNFAPFWTLKPTMEHFVMLFTETLFLRWMINTFIIATLSTAISLFCGLLAAYALSRLRFPFGGALGTWIFVTYLVPQTLLFIPLGEVIRTFNLSDSLLALILTYPTMLIPFSTWLMMGYFRTIPKSLEECAQIDGATRFQAMVRVVFPVAMPGILSAGIFSFTLSWNEFLYALVFLSTDVNKTIPIGVTSELILGDVFYWGPLMAGALLGSIPVAFVYSFFVEHYVSAMTGAVKG